MPLAPGSCFGPYRIISALGKGGMGEVYRAKDSRLDWQVAIKVLSEHLAGNKNALARFEREAKTLAALSHPNIVAIFDIGKDHGAFFVEALTSGYANGNYLQAMSRAAQKLSERSTRVHIPAIRIARLYAHAGMKEETLQWLEKAYEQRELPLIHLNIGWDWDDVRDHPRFQKLLQKMNLT
jgi:serine/threonine protein kinase